MCNIKLSLFFLAIFLSGAVWLSAQEPNTVGLLRLRPAESFPGYNLVYPHNQPNVYLFDQCGRIVHTWTDTAFYRPGNTAYILPNGDLVKTKRHNIFTGDPIWAGGGGAIVEVRTWDNELKHRYELNNADFRLHHDIAPLPNGNVLMVVWARKSREEAIAAGRDAALLPEGEVWSESVFEWDPRQDSIVWQWHLWDHLIAEGAEGVAGRGVVADHPERMNINYDEQDGHPDWLHINAIAYNPVLDQIALSVPNISEYWIIDHSTTTEEAASSTGGRSGRGGDLLYRWGNPRVYDRGGDAEQQLFFQHDVHWADPLAQPGDLLFGLILAFNNRAPNGRSPVYLMDTGFDTLTWSYPFQDDVFGPGGPAQIFMHPEAEPRAMSESVSSSQLLPNGNILIMAGRWGFAYELNPAGELVWEYVVPLRAGSPATQGDTLTINNNLTFRLNRYPTDYPGFEGKDLSPKGYWELNPNEGLCEQLLPAGSRQVLLDDLRLYPNPARRELMVEAEHYLHTTAALLDVSGRLIRMIRLEGDRIPVAVGDLAAGVYWLRAPGRIAKKLVILP